LKVITEKYSGNYFASAVGEVNVVAKMKEVSAVIGGEGNGGVIYPDLHYGRDALVGIALFLSWLARAGMPCSELRSYYPDFYISKNKLELSPDVDPDLIISAIAEAYKEYALNREDGLRIDFDGEWVHLRRSNTEPIIRIYAESENKEKADALAEEIIGQMLKAGC
jgi:phosphomannomutase